MSFNYNKAIFNTNISSKTNNYNVLTEQQLKDGIIKNSPYISINPNSQLYKLSDCINFIQSNGAINYIKDKNYTINSIVSVVYKTNQGLINTTLLRCIKNNTETYCTIIPNNSYTEDDNGNIIFNNSNWDTLYWEEIVKSGETYYNKVIKNFEFKNNLQPNSTDEAQVKHIELFDFTNEQTLSSLNFTIYSDRFRNMTVNCQVTGIKGNIKLSIDIVNCKSVLMDGASTVWYSNSIFKDYALNGIFFSVNEKTNKVYMHYLGIEQLNPMDLDFELDIETDKGYAPLTFKEVTLPDTFINNSDYQLIPIIKGASNKYAGKSLQLLEYIKVLPETERFESGVVRVDKEFTLDKWLYPIANSVINTEAGKWKGTVYDSLERYKVSTNNNTRYIEPKFPDIEGETAYGILYDDTGCTGPFYKGEYWSANGAAPQSYTRAGYSFEVDTSASAPTDGKFCIYPHSDTNSYFSYDLPLKWAPHGSSTNILVAFASDKKNPNRLTTKSGIVYTYIKIV